MSEQNPPSVEAIMEDVQKQRAMLSHRFFFGHVYALFRNTPLYAHWKRLLSWLRRFRTVTVVLRTVGVIFAILEAGALVVLSTALFLVILPLAVAFMLGILITAAIESVRSNRFMAKKLQRGRACVLFMPHNPGAFFAQNASSLAARGYTVLIVSPYLVLSGGLAKTAPKNGFYTTLRRESDGVYLVRRYYFFSLRRHVLANCSVVYVY